MKTLANNTIFVSIRVQIKTMMVKSNGVSKVEDVFFFVSMLNRKVAEIVEVVREIGLTKNNRRIISNSTHF